MELVEYRKNCGFRYKLNRCLFKKENCNSKKCSMYNIEWTKESLIKRIDIEKEELERISKLVSNCKDKKELKVLENSHMDISLGVAYMIEALFYIQMGYFMEYKKIKSKFGLSFFNK